jgi:purine nucleosidase
MIFQPYGGPRCRVITDNDYCGDPDGLVQLVHQILSPSADLRGIIGSHLRDGDAFAPSAETATLSHQRVTEVLSILDRDVPAYAGSNAGLADAETPQPSAGAEAIVAEAMRTDIDLPLYVTFGGGLTELASAYLMEPRIADRLTAIWIGGLEHPDLAPPPPDTPGPEYNFSIDPIAARVVFNDSAISLWQVPRDAYRQAVVGMAELLVHMRPAGQIGAHLYDRLAEIGELAAPAGYNLGETYILGDNPLVLLSTLQSNFHPDPSSSRYVVRPTPYLDSDGVYQPNDDGRPMRVYTHLDIRLMVSDLYAKLALCELRTR